MFKKKCLEQILTKGLQFVCGHNYNFEVLAPIKRIVHIMAFKGKIVHTMALKDTSFTLALKNGQYVSSSELQKFIC